MARSLRVEYEGAVYHVTSRGNERKNIFFSKRDYAKFKEYVAGAEKKYHLIVHAYVLMTNHYHLLVETPEKNLQRVMHYINSSYSIYVNTKKKRSGHLFQGRYKAIIVDKDNYLAELSRYIHLNPVRAKMVEKPESYPHSSYRCYVSSECDEIVTTASILKMFSEDTLVAHTIYKEFVENPLASTASSPLDGVYGGAFLGDEEFVNEVLGNLDEESIGNENIANRKALKHSLAAEAIIAQLSGLKRLDVKLRKQMNLTKLTVYLLKKYSNATNKQISELIGRNSYSSAAKIYERFVKEMEGDSVLKNDVRAIEAALSLVKARPP